MIWAMPLQASMFLMTASSTPLKCLWPSLSMDCTIGEEGKFRSKWLDHACMCTDAAL